ncbi:MAG TPA: HAD family phosphatase [Anaerolineales bacterium]|nr:HAD family phosphatase [Anaerolineales bacterium]
MDKPLQNYAVLWDMDGVLVDTGDLHYETWKIALAEEGYTISKENFDASFGMNNEMILEKYFGLKSGDQKSVQISIRKEVLFREMAPGNVHLLPDVRNWLAWFQSQGVRQAVASSAPCENIELLVDVLEIRPYFNTLVSGAEMPGKPNPDVFLHAAEQVGVPPARCLVVEDAVHGVTGAHAAGMKCIAVTTTNSAEALSQADLVLVDLTELREEAFLGLLDKR